MKKLTLSEVEARLCAAHNPIILIHVNPDGDALGCAAALCHFYIMRGEKVSLLCASSLPARLAFLTEDLTLSPVSVSTDDTDRTVIAVDIAAPAQLGSLREQFAHGRTNLMIDHHAIGEPFADHFILPEAAAAGEILTEIFRNLAEKKEICSPPQALWSALYASISSDTGCFRYSNATSATHDAAAFLLRQGVDGAHINHLLFDSKSRELLTAEGLTAASIRTAADGKISYAVISRADLQSNQLKEEHFETAIDIVRSLSGAVISFVLKEQPNGIFKVSLRSTGADVASVAALFGGGGHIRAAGCTLSGKDAISCIDTLIPHLEALL